ncbi:hypothetical protein PtA15_10A510 [Puccinia triticina]|uniref:Uncharacterized protein n=1 Tax=Puccinia triticina TaxID=208348 RepID=A0ABY7CYK6_9BASI|nr:uncharacterized protein PtA15_10A510 [Puccinia triticina]WAQ89087.1 hypothetical protein PtA15_10A510 [Puccinia triticina]WAR59146.1 hypothetical protein PtB15_10B488 [Puccinia triticina]
MAQLFGAGSNSHGQLGTSREGEEDLHGFGNTHRWTAEHLQPDQPVSSSIGGRHALFLLHHPTHPEIYLCGDNGQGQLGPAAPSTASTPSSPSADKPNSTSTMQKLDYKLLVSSTVNIDQKLKDLLILKYRPTQVQACWETSFVVLSPSFDGPDRASPPSDGEEEEEEIGYDDHILAFGSNNFGLRGATKEEDLPADPSMPNLVDQPPVFGRSGSIKRRIKLYGGCQHLVAVVECGGSGGPIKLVALGNQHSVVVCPAEIWCWGSNRNAQIPAALSQLPPAHILELQASWNATFVILSQLPGNPTHNRLLGFGSNSHGQLDAGLPDPPAHSTTLDRQIPALFSNLVAGSEHLLLANRLHPLQIWGWGWNEHGNLGKPPGQELQQSRTFTHLFSLPAGSKLLTLDAGCATSFIICSSP